MVNATSRLDECSYANLFPRECRLRRATSWEWCWTEPDDNLKFYWIAVQSLWNSQEPFLPSIRCREHGAPPSECCANVCKMRHKRSHDGLSRIWLVLIFLTTCYSLGLMSARRKAIASILFVCHYQLLTGSSTGVPNEVGLNLDAVTVMEYAKNHPKYELQTLESFINCILCLMFYLLVILLITCYPTKRCFKRLKNSHLVAFGRSLGGAVAMSLAHKHPDIIKAVIAENTFLSVGKKPLNEFSLLLSCTYQSDWIRTH